MVQDFAKSGRRSQPGALRQQTESDDAPQTAASTLLLTGGVAGLALGLFISFMVYVSGWLPAPPGQGSATMAQQEPQSSSQGLSEELERAAQRLQLEFYQELPNYEVIVDVTPLELPPWQLPQPPGSRPPEPPAAVAEEGSGLPDSGLPEGLTLAEEDTAAPAEPTVAPAAESSAAPTPAPPPVAGGPSYVLQVGAFQQENSANQQRDRLLSMGLLDSYVRQEALLGRTLYLVQTGPYDREQVAQVERMLRSNNVDSMRITVGNR